MTSAVDETFKAIRQACSASLWSQAVELVRASAVAGVSDSDEEVVCRVRTPNRVVAPKVTLYPLDEEWDCDCDSKLPCCEHVAAAIIAVRRARQEGVSLPDDARSGAHLVYRFKSTREHLILERFVESPGSPAEKLERSVAGIASSASDTRRLTPTQSDIAIDRLMGARLHGPLAGESLQGVLIALGGAPHVELDGKPVSVEGTPVKPVAAVLDDGKGFKVTIDRDPRIATLVVPGIGRNGDQLFVLGETELSGLSLERLPSSRSYGPREVSALVTEVLPSLMKRVPVEVRTERLPKLTRSLRPSIALDVEQVGNTLSVLATLVYGQNARIDGSRLVHLDGDVPIRDEEAEKRVARRLEEQLGLVPGNRVIVNGGPAAVLAERLDHYQGEIRGRAPESFIKRRGLEARIGFDVASLTIDFEVAGAGAPRRASAEAVLSAWQSGLGLVPLVEGGWAPLPAGWLERHGRGVAEPPGGQQASGEKGAPPGQAVASVGQVGWDLGREATG